MFGGARIGRPFTYPRDLCKRGRKSQDGPGVFRGRSLVFFAPKQTIKTRREDCGEYRQAAGAIAAIKCGFLLFGRIDVRVHNALDRVIASRAR
jgi:hypothetical protein